MLFSTLRYIISQAVDLGREICLVKKMRNVEKAADEGSDEAGAESEKHGEKRPSNPRGEASAGIGGTPHSSRCLNVSTFAHISDGDNK